MKPKEPLREIKEEDAKDRRRSKRKRVSFSDTTTIALFVKDSSGNASNSDNNNTSRLASQFNVAAELIDENCPPDVDNSDVDNSVDNSVMKLDVTIIGEGDMSEVSALSDMVLHSADQSTNITQDDDINGETIVTTDITASADITNTTTDVSSMYINAKVFMAKINTSTTQCDATVIGEVDMSTDVSLSTSLSDIADESYADNTNVEDTTRQNIICSSEGFLTKMHSHNITENDAISSVKSQDNNQSLSNVDLDVIEGSFRNTPMVLNCLAVDNLSISNNDETKSKCLSNGDNSVGFIDEIDAEVNCADSGCNSSIEGNNRHVETKSDIKQTVESSQNLFEQVLNKDVHIKQTVESSQNLFEQVLNKDVHFGEDFGKNHEPNPNELNTSERNLGESANMNISDITVHVDNTKSLSEHQKRNKSISDEVHKKVGCMELNKDVDEVKENLGPNDNEVKENLGPNDNEVEENLGPNDNEVEENLGPNDNEVEENLGPNDNEVKENEENRTK